MDMIKIKMMITNKFEEARRRKKCEEVMSDGGFPESRGGVLSLTRTSTYVPYQRAIVPYFHAATHIILPCQLTKNAFIPDQGTITHHALMHALPLYAIMHAHCTSKSKKMLPLT